MVLENHRDRGNLNPLSRYFFVDLYVYSAAFSAATSWFSASFVTPGTKLSICLSGMASIIAAIMETDEYKDLRDFLGLDRFSQVLMFSTEGNTDPMKFRKVLWDGEYPTV